MKKTNGYPKGYLRDMPQQYADLGVSEEGKPLHVATI